MNLFDEILSGKITPEQLPDGYPYVGTEEKVIEFDDDSDLFMEGFPIFNVGDTVNVKVDGVEYSLVANEFFGTPYIGDTPEELDSGNYKYGWYVVCFEGNVLFGGREPHTVSWKVPKAHPIDHKFLPEGYAYKDVSKRTLVKKVKVYNGWNDGHTEHCFAAPLSQFEDFTDLYLGDKYEVNIAFGDKNDRFADPTRLSFIAYVEELPLENAEIGLKLVNDDGSLFGYMFKYTCDIHGETFGFEWIDESWYEFNGSVQIWRFDTETVTDTKITKMGREYLPDGYPYEEETLESILEGSCNPIADYEWWYMTLYQCDRIKVVCDGVEYDCPVREGSYTYYIGNNSLVANENIPEGGLGDIVDTGEPFFIGAHSYNSSYSMFYQEGEHIYSAYKLAKKVIRMDIKYMPLIKNTMGKYYKLIVTSDGKVEAVQVEE